MRSLTEGRESRVIFTFALPMLIGNVLQQVYNLTDAWVVGTFVGKTALAAVGVDAGTIGTAITSGQVIAPALA